MAFTDDDIARLAADVKKAEGFRLKAYRCSAGVLTVGYGHNCESSPVPGVKKVGDSISHEQAEVLFERDLSKCVWQVRENLPWVINLNAPRQAVLYEMAFQLGLGGMLGFKNTLLHIERGNYADGAAGFLSSKWAKQTPGRVRRLAAQLHSGEWGGA